MCLMRGVTFVLPISCVAVTILATAFIDIFDQPAKAFFKTPKPLGILSATTLTG